MLAFRSLAEMRADARSPKVQQQRHVESTKVQQERHASAGKTATGATRGRRELSTGHLGDAPGSREPLGFLGAKGYAEVLAECSEFEIRGRGEFLALVKQPHRPLQSAADPIGGP